MKTFELAPGFAERVSGAARETRFQGTRIWRACFRKPYGAGWALVGDAGYHKDPITALGIADAFRDAEGVSAAIGEALCGRRSFDDAMGAFQRARDEQSLALYDFTCEFAKIEPPPPQMQQLLGAVSQSPEACKAFASVMAGTLPVPAFFGPDNVARIMREAGQVGVAPSSARNSTLSVCRHSPYSGGWRGAREVRG